MSEVYMKITIVKFGCAILLASMLSGCVAGGYYGEPAPYYGGVAPYYGTAYVPTYAFGEVGGYYPYHRSVNIYSRYNNNYWHHQYHGRQGAPAHGNARSAGGHSHR